MTEEDLEQFAVSWFEDIGRDYLHNPSSAPGTATAPAALS
jgi:hypothetical protein